MKIHIPSIFWYLIFSFHVARSYSTINVSLGFVAPLDDTYDEPLTSLGKELASAFKLAVFAVNKIESSVKLSTNFVDLVWRQENESACKLAGAKYHEHSNVVGVVGGYSSICSIAMQKELLKKGSKMAQVSYRSQSLKLLDKMKFPTFFRTSSNNKNEAQVIVDIIKHFRWNQAGIIHSSDTHYGKELSDEIVSKSKNSEIYIRERKSFSSTDPEYAIEEKLQAIKSSGSRINIIVAQGADFFRVVKQIRRKHMVGEGWVWIVSDGGTSLYPGGKRDINITTSGFIGVAPEMFSGQTIVNIAISWFERDPMSYPGKLWRSAGEPLFSPYVGQVFRAVSAYHSALTELVAEKKLNADTPVSKIRGLIIEKFESKNNFKASLKSILGEGIFFDERRESEPKFTIVNQVHGEFKEVGTWHENASPTLNLPIGNINWPGGSSQTPTDKGKPGKALFRIAFISPTNNALGILGDYGKELSSAFKVSLELINNDDNYLVELDGLVKDEGFDGDESCHKLAEDMKELNLVAIVGAYRSSCSMRLHNGLGSESTRMPIISYASPSVKLSNKTEYKYFFRIPPSNVYQSEIIKLIIEKFKFKQIAIIYSDEVSSMEIAKSFEESLENETTSIVKSVKFPRNSDAMELTNYVEKIRESGARVIFISALPNDVVKIEQIAQQKKMTGKGWIWLGSDGASSDYFRSTPNLATAMNGMLGVTSKRGEGSLYLKLLSKWNEKDRLNYPGIIHDVSERSMPYTAQVFDAVNGIARALSDLISRRAISHRTNSLTVRAHLFNKLESYNTERNGYSSALSSTRNMFFDKNKDGPKIYDVINLVVNPSADWRHIADFKADRKLEKIRYLKEPLFPGGLIVPIIGAGKMIYKIAAFFPKNPELGALSDLGKVWESAFTAAINWVNKNDSLTVGFDVTYYDTGQYSKYNNCYGLARNLPAYFDIVVGAARSECTVRIYEQIQDHGIPLFTYASTSALLSEKTSYPNVFRLCPSDKYQAAALADFVERHNWDRVGIVATKGIYGEELSTDLKQQLSTASIEITTKETFERGSKRIKQEVSNLKVSGSGVNIIISNPQDALQIFQEAFELGMVGKGWTWLGSDGAVSTLFKRSQNLQRVMDGMVGFRPKGGAGFLFESIFKEWSRFDPMAERQVSYVAQVFDTVLIPAFALHKLHSKQIITPQSSKDYARQSFLNELKSKQSMQVGYPSTTGTNIQFDVHQDSNPQYELVNLNGNKWIKVGTFENGRLDLTSMVVWAGGRVKIPPSNPPMEKPEIQERERGTSQGLIVLAVVFSIFGLLVIIFMLYIVRRVRYRHLYMQSDLNQGGVFSVLYGHTVNPQGTGVRTLMTTNSSHIKRHSLEASIELTDPMMPRHL